MQNFEEKLNKIKEQLPRDLENVNILWNINSLDQLQIDNFPTILLLNLLNKSNKTFVILNQKTFENEFKLNIGKIIKLNDIFPTEEYQKYFHELSSSIKIIEILESMQKCNEQSTIDEFRASDLMNILIVITNLIYLDINLILIEEHQQSLYCFISSLLLNQYNRTLTMIEIPKLPQMETKISLNSSKEELEQYFAQLKSDQMEMIDNYFKDFIKIFQIEEKKFSLKRSLLERIRLLLKSSSRKSDDCIYIAASFLTDQFDVLKQHWKKNSKKNSKSTGTGKGINDLQANQIGFEPELGGKFVIINWTNKEIVYSLDLDTPSGFFIEDHYLYIANNRLNSISIIDLIQRKEIKRIENRSFNDLHSLHRTENNSFLVTSTGIDAILHLNSQNKIIEDWYATEHGYSTTPKGQLRFVQRDFDHHLYNYPTLHQTTHVNSAIIFDSEYYLATLFHQGLLVKINRSTGETIVLLSHLKCPHAIQRFQSNQQTEIEFMLCNTKQSQILLLNQHFQIVKTITLEDISWLQDATQIQNQNILLTDANHSTIIEIDSQSNSIVSEFSYSNNWRIYQISDLCHFKTNFIELLNL
mgnify:FL=1